MKKTLLIASMLLIALSFSQLVQASEEPKPKKKEATKLQSNEKEESSAQLPGTCSTVVYSHQTCCNGDVVLAGWISVGYWCDSGVVFHVDYFLDDSGCGYVGCI